VNYGCRDGNEDLARLYAVDALPVTLLIDRDGKIAASYPGMVDKDNFENEIRVLLQERAKNARSSGIDCLTLPGGYTHIRN